MKLPKKLGRALLTLLALCCSAYAQPQGQALPNTAPTGGVRVCCRSLPKWSGAKNWFLLGLNKLVVKQLRHCYIEISDPGTAEGASVHGQTSAIHPIQPDNKDKQPIPDQITDSLLMGGECKNVEDATPEKIKLLREELATGTCPSCGDDYHNRVLSGCYNNSNTYVFELISRAGMTPPKMKCAPGYRREHACVRRSKERKANP